MTAATVANGISDTVELTPAEEQSLQEAKTPKVVGTATTESGLVGTIIYHPIEEKYSVKFPTGYEVFNKNKEFRSQEDAEWYVTDVVGVREEPSVPDWFVPGIPEDGELPGDAVTPSPPLPPRPPHTGRFI